MSERRRGNSRGEGLALAIARVTVLAPGGFVAGYAVGRGLGRIVSGCPLAGACVDATPVLLAWPLAILGMGAGSTFAASRVGEWWQGMLVWAVGIVSLLVFVVVIGWLGSDSAAGLVIALTWLVAALAVAGAAWRRL